MLTRIISALVAAPLFLYAIVALPPVWVAAIVAVMAAVAACELAHTVGVGRKLTVYIPTAAAAACAPFLVLSGVEKWGLWTAALVLLAILFFLAILDYGKENCLTPEQIMYCLFGGIVIPVFLTSLLRLRMTENGSFAVLLPVVVAFSADTGAYFTGVWFGKHRGITAVSPNKSAEGFVGGLLWAVGFVLLYGAVLQRYFALSVDFARLALYGLLGGLASELGDLSFSLIKRRYGVKDYGKFLPGHGGMLDRFDSMSFVAPTIWILMTALPAL